MKIEQIPDNNTHEYGFAPEETEQMLKDPEYLRETIVFLNQQIVIEKTLGHSLGTLETDLAKYQGKLDLLNLPQDTHPKKDAA